MTEKLTEKQERFCFCYAHVLSQRKAAEMAGYSKNYGWDLCQKPLVRQRIAQEKKRMEDSFFIQSTDVLHMYMRIAFADITDYVSFGQDGEGRNYLTLKNSADMEGQLIDEVSVTGSGAKIKLADRMKALEKLERFFDLMGVEAWKKYVDEQRLKSNEKDVMITVDTGIVREEE